LFISEMIANSAGTANLQSPSTQSQFNMSNYLPVTLPKTFFF